MTDNKDARHTIVLAQFGNSAASKQFSDFDSVGDAMDGICQMYEFRLKQENPNQRKIKYDITDLYSYIDQLPDLSCLVFNPNIAAYLPYNKKWIKDSVFDHLKRSVSTQ